MCAVPNMAVFCSSFTSCFPVMLLLYFLNDFEMVPIAPFITGITVVFALLLWLLLLLLYRHSNVRLHGDLHASSRHAFLICFAPFGWALVCATLLVVLCIVITH